MATLKREKTKYPGVTFITVPKIDGNGTDKKYYIRYRMGGRGSKEVEEPVGRASEGMTASKANLIRAERKAGKELCNTARREQLIKDEAQVEEKYTVKKLWEIYADHHRDKPTLKRMDVVFFPFLAPLHDRPVETLTTRDIVDLSRKLSSTPCRRNPEKCLSPQTIKHILGLLKRILLFAANIEICPFPNALKIAMPKIDNQKTENMTKEQISAYLKALDEEEDQDSAAILRLALFTGMRKNALLNLQWSDIDFSNNLIKLRGAVAKNRETQFIPLSPAARDVLLQVRRQNSPYIFPGRDGGKRYDFQRMPRRVREKAGLPKDFRPMHGLRHTFASSLASSGEVGLYTLQKLMTHGSPAMTQRYAHLADETMKRAASVADEIFSLPSATTDKI